jgi:hypothetical protein
MLAVFHLEQRVADAGAVDEGTPRIRRGSTVVRFCGNPDALAAARGTSGRQFYSAGLRGDHGRCRVAQAEPRDLALLTDMHTESPMERIAAS